MTLTLLLDYGLLSQFIFSDPGQIYLFSRKIATIVLNTFATINNLFVELYIDRKLLEWDKFGVILAQYKIVVRFHKFKTSLF